MKVQFDKMAHLSQRGIHIKPGTILYAHRLKNHKGNDWLLSWTKSRKTQFATVDGSFIFENAHKAM